MSEWLGRNPTPTSVPSTDSTDRRDTKPRRYPRSALGARRGDDSVYHRLPIAAFRDELIWWAGLYAKQGFPVFPVRSDKRPLIKWKEGASTDPLQINHWWSKWPIAMIGMPTGKPSGFVVLDVDVKNGLNGFETLRRNDWQIPPDTIEIKTPSGGSHFYFRLKKGEDLPNSASKLGPGLDIRGTGGFIILPPSRPKLDGLDYCYAEGQNLEAGRLE